MRFAFTKHGFVALLFGKEISYAHFPEALGIAWTRQLVLGKRRWYFTEGWRLFYRSTPTKRKYYFAHQGR